MHIYTFLYWWKAIWLILIFPYSSPYADTGMKHPEITFGLCKAETFCSSFALALHLTEDWQFMLMILAHLDKSVLLHMLHFPIIFKFWHIVTCSETARLFTTRCAEKLLWNMAHNKIVFLPMTFPC